MQPRTETDTWNEADWRDAGSIAAAVNTGKTRAVDITAAALERIRLANPVLNAFTEVTADRAMARAVAVDAMRAANGWAGWPACRSR